MTTDDLASSVASAPRRRLATGRFWHQGPTSRPFGSFADPTDTNGRYHRAGGAGVWYASDQEQAAWGELFRHFVGVDVDPFEVRRRIGHVDVADLEVLDLTDDQVRQRLGISIADLTSDDYSVTQTIAEAARHAGFGGILAPSAALQGRRTLVIFARGTTALAYGPSSVRMPPVRMRHLQRSIRRHRHDR